MINPGLPTFLMLFSPGSDVSEVVMSHVEAGVVQEFLELGVFYSVFVHDGGSGEYKLVGRRYSMVNSS